MYIVNTSWLIGKISDWLKIQASNFSLKLSSVVQFTIDLWNFGGDVDNPYVSAPAVASAALWTSSPTVAMMKVYGLYLTSDGDDTFSALYLSNPSSRNFKVYAATAATALHYLFPAPVRVPKGWKVVALCGVHGTSTSIAVTLLSQMYPDSR